MQYNQWMQCLIFHPMTYGEGTVVIPTVKRGNGGSERFSNLPKVMQQVGDKPRVSTLTALVLNHQPILPATVSRDRT